MCVVKHQRVQQKFWRMLRCAPACRQYPAWKYIWSYHHNSNSCHVETRSGHTSPYKLYGDRQTCTRFGPNRYPTEPSSVPLPTRCYPSQTNRPACLTRPSASVADVCPVLLQTRSGCCQQCHATMSDSLDCQKDLCMLPTLWSSNYASTAALKHLESTSASAQRSQSWIHPQVKQLQPVNKSNLLHGFVSTLQKAKSFSGC